VGRALHGPEDVPFGEAAGLTADVAGDDRRLASVLNRGPHFGCPKLILVHRQPAKLFLELDDSKVVTQVGWLSTNSRFELVEETDQNLTPPSGTRVPNVPTPSPRLC
jgi:hypothetical protein